MQQKRKRQFSGLRQSYAHKQKVAEIQPRSSIIRNDPNMNSNRTNVINRYNNDDNDKKINGFQQLNNNFLVSQGQNKRVKEEKYKEQRVQNKDPKQICVNCINKMMVTKHQREQSQKKQRDRRQQKQKLQKEKQELFQQKLQKISKMQQSLQINKGLIQQKVRKNMDEKSYKNHLLQQIKYERKERELQQQKIIQQQRLKKQKFRKQLQSQIQNKKQNKIKNLIQQKDRQITTFFNEDEINQKNKKKLQDYRNQLLHQISQKQSSVKQKKMKEKQFQKRYIQDILNNPNLQYTLPSNSLNIKKQIESKQILKKNQELQRRKNQELQRKEQAQIEIQQRRILTDQKINQMKKYVQDLGIQLEETKRKRKQQRQYKLKPAFSIVGDPFNDFKNCNNCDLKFPSNYLSKVYDF